MNKRKWLAAGLVAVSALALAACGNKSSNGPTAKPASMQSTYSATGPANGNNSTLKVAEINDAPFKGISLAVLQDNAEDQDVYSPGGEDQLFNNDKNFKITDGGLANQRLNNSAKTDTITLRSDAKWSDGSKVTARDIEYPYEIIANKNTTSQQYSADFTDIKGMAAYHTGKASTISGFTYPHGQNGNQLVIHFSSMKPAMKYSGNSFIWGTVAPYEKLKNVPIAKLASADEVRKNPVFIGPYKLASQVTGESTSWVPNKYYYGPAPKIKHITIQVVSSNNSTAAFKSKKFDFNM